MGWEGVVGGDFSRGENHLTSFKKGDFREMICEIGDEKGFFSKLIRGVPVESRSVRFDTRGEKALDRGFLRTRTDTNKRGREDRERVGANFRDDVSEVGSKNHRG